MIPNNIQYTQEQFDKATKKLFKLLTKNYPKEKKEQISCIDIQGIFPLVQWRPNPTSHVSLTIQLQDDGGEPYAVINAAHMQHIKGPTKHKDVCYKTEFANIYPDQAK